MILTVIFRILFTLNLWPISQTRPREMENVRLWWEGEAAEVFLKLKQAVLDFPLQVTTSYPAQMWGPRHFRPSCLSCHLQVELQVGVKFKSLLIWVSLCPFPVNSLPYWRSEKPSKGGGVWEFTPSAPKISISPIKLLNCGNWTV